MPTNRCSTTPVPTKDGKTYYYQGFLVKIVVPPRWEGDKAHVRIDGGKWDGEGYNGAQVGECLNVVMKDLIDLEAYCNDKFG